MDGMTLVRLTNGVVGRIFPERTATWAVRTFTTPRRPDRPEPPVGQRQRLSVGWSVVTFGTSGPKVLAVHGWEGRATQFARMADALVAAGFQVIALDGPAHGQSPEESVHAVAFARAILDVDRELGPFHGVVGHSMGGGAVVFAKAWGLRADRTVLIAPPSSIEAVLARFSAFVGLPDAAHRAFEAAMTRKVGTAPSSLEVSELAETQRGPALVVHDEDDAEVPFDEGLAIASAWPEGRLMRTRGLGHRRILKAPEVIAEVVGFLG